MKPPQPHPSPGGPLRLIRAAVMPLTVHSLSTHIVDLQPLAPGPSATPKSKLAVATLR